MEGMTSTQPTGPSSTALVVTDRPARYGKQLAAHLGRRLPTTWDDAAGRGAVDFPFGLARMESADDGLRLYVEVGSDAGPDLQGSAGLDRLEDVVGRHLVRFGTREELTVRWVRSDGSEGTTYVGAGDSD
jgi:hypothetical protein